VLVVIGGIIPGRRHPEAQGDRRQGDLPAGTPMQDIIDFINANRTNQDRSRMKL
jgi:methylmalonyl-CoA mutase cobalamin-binding subunit